MSRKRDAIDSKLNAIMDRIENAESVYSRTAVSIIGHIYDAEIGNKLSDQKSWLDRKVTKYLCKNAFLQKRGTSEIFRFTEILARRDDMELIPDKKARAILKRSHRRIKRKAR